jgi:hypothetical protein
MTGGPYTAFIEEYLVACQPDLPIDMKQFGWSAETPDSFLLRTDKDLVPWKPTVATLRGKAKTATQSPGQIGAH